MVLEQMSLLSGAILMEETKQVTSIKGKRSKPMGEDSERAEAILKHAFEVFTEAGYAAARMEEIATRAGVAKGLIYFYYKNKETLFEAVLREFVTFISLTLAENPAESMAKRLVRILELLYTDIVGSAVFTQMARLLLIDGPRFPDAQRACMLEMITPVREDIRECLAEGARRGEWQERDIPGIPFMTAPMFMFMLWRMISPGQEPDISHYAREHQRHMLRSLKLSEEAVAEAMEAVGAPVEKRKRPVRTRTIFRRKKN